MTQTKHTPGPWELVVKNDKYGKEVIVVGKSIGDESLVVCGCIMDPNYDGFLIAAAPELLRVLELIINSDMAQREEDEGNISIELAHARDAIAKAKGEQA